MPFNIYPNILSYPQNSHHVSDLQSTILFPERLVPIYGTPDRVADDPARLAKWLCTPPSSNKRSNMTKGCGVFAHDSQQLRDDLNTLECSIANAQPKMTQSGSVVLSVLF
jgi:hypothetical protein